MKKFIPALLTAMLLPPAVLASTPDMGVKYGLTPADCKSANVVRVDGFATTTKCYQPTSEIPAGLYTFDKATSTLNPKATTASAPAQKTTFRCVAQQNGGFATIAYNGRATAVLLSWRTSYFGDQFSPQKRCQIVTERFNRAVNVNGGRMQNLLLLSGVLNNQNVICFGNQAGSSCNSENLLFTLRPGNKPAKVLADMGKFSVRGTGTVFESGAGSGDQVSVDLGEWERANFGDEPVKSGSAGDTGGF
jgi:hypothetical protein